MSGLITRRAMLTGIAAGAGGLVAGCDQLSHSTAVKAVLFKGEDVHRALQRALMSRTSLAPEYRPDQMSPRFRTNGTANPGTDAYNALAANRFADWRLHVTGLVNHPLSLSLDQLRAMPTRVQITRHDCVEGWSAIGKWHGPQLALLLRHAGLQDAARYIVFDCADFINGHAYYESIDLVDAFHPQTILAWAMNNQMLSVGHGAPLRLRVERQLGYKQAKYIMGIRAVASLDGIGQGKGGFWEDVADYEWYAGI